uniref:Protein transport protein sec16 n=1 Tax=Coturnix japonica TaxID=93934 RepID=A0A8C2UIZ1_COTJA
YEDPHWQYPAAAYRDNRAYQSHQWQPTAWQGDRGTSGSMDGPRVVMLSPGWASFKDLSSFPCHAMGQPSLLQQYRESGLSSSGYELSQYIRDGAEPNDTAFSGGWSPVQKGGTLESAVVAPHKFLQPHVPVCLGAGGQLVLVCPHRPAEGQLPLVELHSLEVILQGTTDQEELQAFPGPLAREDLHKVDVVTFCQQKIASSCDLSTQRGRDSALLWKLLVLLCRQNGSMVGSDVAELLMQDCRQQERYKRQEPALGPISLADEEWRQLGTLDLITGEVPPVVETQAQIVEKFTKLLYYGRKKDALVWAMRNQLWGHALFLSSKMDPRTYSWVLTGFTSTLATNDPLQTFFQLMSGRIPQASQSCGDAKWGDWRPHLAVLLSNKVGDMELNHRAIITMGDTLAGKGAVEAAHFCYLMADIPFGYFGVKADRMALLGSSHRQAFTQFATTEAIQRMEIFEYCQQLRHPTSFLLPFQVYKLLYASRLADHGLPAQALLYCEQIATMLLQQDPTSHPVLAQQLAKLAERLKLCDPLLLEMPEQDPALEPEWLLRLRTHCQHCEVRSSFGHALSSAFPSCPLLVGWKAVLVLDVWLSPAWPPSSIHTLGRMVLAVGFGDVSCGLMASSPAPCFDTESCLCQSSGFRWFGWFRSKPQKETSPKATTSGSPTAGLQVGGGTPRMQHRDGGRSLPTSSMHSRIGAPHPHPVLSQLLSPQQPRLHTEIPVSAPIAELLLPVRSGTAGR